MRKKIATKKLNRSGRSRRAMYRSLVRSLAEHGKIKTTKAKAKATQPKIDRILRLVAQGDLSARRQTLSMLGNDKETVQIFFDKYKELATSRSSGFTRLTKLLPRKGDSAEMAILELIETSKKNENDSSKNK
ncbi:MAG: 50S ribosomal protein L17 [Candidatus Woesebacteria bacterium GW2011_GWB1_43_14]|uniref:50S ribosomal protein L17 n=1 Tax=Candidatus Woesebacteria bacterium GW2011_GWB1_43_14 TaxID=1618578 RepID=A0A0G1FQR3_9BACT|nr:MAG: 50S ribosomal protein L17 [Candidatus Woesebacteria bacterium GW2011_GWA1_39_11b]KKS78044.1 MAG: 50S ribosomal protein L17 [Candidatus Woesebacteria bacterium GW2011_GWC1_42_9]KKS97376.1 MAG: 50S ribosomal protein L17 [Candidatus Woesebacteria bacterium GW2011_GWB1_43_14]